MSCEKNDDDLLFLLHGQLGVVGKTLVIGHLLTCAACRDRYREFHHASLLMMNASVPLGGGLRRNRIDLTLQPMLALRGLMPVFFVTLALGVLLLGWSRMQVRASSTAEHVRPAMCCRPNLPNDHCR